MSDSLAYAIARAIRAERARAGMTQRQLGERVGLHEGTITAIEALKRKVNADELPEFCEALGVTLLELMARASDDDKRRMGLPRSTPSWPLDTQGDQH